MSPKMLWELSKQTFKDWQEDKAARLGAALAYYTIFSLAPLLVIVVAIAGLAFGQSQARDAILAQVAGLVGPQGAALIGTALENASRPGTSIAATIVGVATLLLGASGVFGQLQDALNTIWEVQPRPGGGILAMLRKRFISFTMVLGLGFLLLVSLVISAALTGLGTYLGRALPVPNTVLEAINLVISFAVVTLLFALIFKVLPDARIAWRDVWIGSVVTALLFTIGRFLIGLYLGSGSVGSAYGAAGALIVILAWTYYAAQILFLGAEFTQVYANRYGSRVQPDENAVPVTEDARAQQGMATGKKATAVPARTRVESAHTPAPALAGRPYLVESIRPAGHHALADQRPSAPVAPGVHQRVAPGGWGPGRPFWESWPGRYSRFALSLAAVLSTAGALLAGLVRYRDRERPAPVAARLRERLPRRRDSSWHLPGLST